MSKPTTLTPWNTNQSNVIQPNAERQADGWLVREGVPEKPALQYFNYMMNEYYQWFKAINETGIVEWDAITAYSEGALTKGSDFVLYQAKTSSTNVNPVGDSSGAWEVAFLSGTAQTEIDEKINTTSGTLQDNIDDITFSLASVSEIQTGTETEPRTLSPALIKTSVDTHGLSLGTTSSTACAGDDSRLSNARQCNNTFVNATTSRTNLGLGSKCLGSQTISTSNPSGGVSGDVWYKV